MTFDIELDDSKTIYITNFANVIPPEDIQMLKNELSESDITVKSTDTEGQPMAFAELDTVVSILIHSAVLTSLVESIGQSATWDLIKLFASKSWKRIKGQKYTKLYLSGGSERKDITFGINATINNADYTFRFDNVSPDDANEALDKILDFFKEQTNHQKWSTHIGNYNNDKQEWELKELREIVKELNKNK
ncbi:MULTISPECIES: hypothetical protein [Bacillus]|uniref:hypothetical protein n=1 Tax=Bacillus TaxID=1386 RepID=UPI0001CE37A5|nr:MULTISPECIES: hypothetical protein [Bacillus]AMK71143.1 hypothetical protein AWV81_02835 [Bacillus subtilis subsp. natto]API44803.1 hypothetical protein BSR08_21310 [Bacillus subtilis]API96097.1 hypothetical protein BKP58_09490 [Bacillus subtilis]ARI87194.1 hypothetical protein B7470_14465 [Bacillus subtilis]AVL05564.1 hypothetical protein BS21228_15035 [Bacillus subtilis]